MLSSESTRVAPGAAVGGGHRRWVHGRVAAYQIGLGLRGEDACRWAQAATQGFRERGAQAAAPQVCDRGTLAAGWVRRLVTMRIKWAGSCVGFFLLLFFWCFGYFVSGVFSGWSLFCSPTV
ncbi:hypothetical protein TIFTF001_012150 [Ficus carica]|uniref:Uncharacterized protein n=1 Tax=Ficus carica TaxID=3494 RepID=A0AA87ZZV9_FICCA|nr:hypothetical protein TIFTF001_012150 [Ficus carica]